MIDGGCGHQWGPLSAAQATGMAWGLLAVCLRGYLKFLLRGSIISIVKRRPMCWRQCSFWQSRDLKSGHLQAYESLSSEERGGLGELPLLPDSVGMRAQAPLRIFPMARQPSVLGRAYCCPVYVKIRIKVVSGPHWFDCEGLERTAGL